MHTVPKLVTSSSCTKRSRSGQTVPASLPAAPGQTHFNWWDTGGHLRYRSLLFNYYHNINTLIIVVDLTDLQSIDSATEWLQEFPILNGPQRKNVVELYLWAIKWTSV